MIHRDSTGKSTASLPTKFRTSIDYDKIVLVNDYSVLFVWVDELEEEYTHSTGIVIARTLAKNRERWGVVVKTHPTSEVQIGEYIAVDKVHEPFGCVVNGLEHWMTYDNDIKLVTSDKSVTESLNGDVEKIKLPSGPER